MKIHLKVALLVCTCAILKATPWWIAKPVGNEDRVPSIFTPVRITKPNEVSIWGRTYLFGRSLFPIQLHSQKQTLLAAPIELHLRTDGANTPIRISDPQLAYASDTRAIILTHGHTNRVSISVKHTIEFDGMIFSTFTLKPRQSKEVIIESLKVVFPFNENQTALTHRSWGYVSTPAIYTGKTPQQWSSGWNKHNGAPFVWLGNEQVGFSWFMVNYNWHNNHPETMLRGFNRNHVNFFELNVIDKDLRLDAPRSFSFGFTVLPAKPMPANWLGPQPMLDPWWDESNQYLHEALTPEQWREEVNLAHAQGRRITKYSQTQYLCFYGDLSAKDAAQKPGKHYRITPERKQYEKEWRMFSWGINGKAPVLCTNSHWADLLCAGLQQRLELGNFDGIYFDCSMPYRCKNPTHGCVYNTRDTLGQRNVRRRLCNIFDQLKRPPLIWEHISDNMMGPIMNFTTYHYDGEQWASRYVEDYRKALPLDRMRAFSIGTNWGHIPVYMAFSKGGELPTNTLMAVWTLHMPFHFVNGWVTPIGLEARKLDAEFGFDNQTRRLGYWENSHVIQGQTDTLKATIYYKPNKAFLVISNLSDSQKKINMRMSLYAIGLKSTEISRYLNNQDMPPLWDGKSLKITLKPASCTMMILVSK